MRLLNAFIVLAGLAAAVPMEGPKDVHFQLDKRASCAAAFDCVTKCCKEAGGCLALSCSKSKCIFPGGLDQAYCECHCSYG